MLSQAHWLGNGDLGLSEVGTGSYLHEASHIWASLHLLCLYWSSMDSEQKPDKYVFQGQRSGWCQSNENTTHLSWEDEEAGVQGRQLRGQDPNRLLPCHLCTAGHLPVSLVFTECPSRARKFALLGLRAQEGVYVLRHAWQLST